VLSGFCEAVFWLYSFLSISPHVIIPLSLQPALWLLALHVTNASLVQNARLQHGTMIRGYDKGIEAFLQGKTQKWNKIPIHRVLPKMHYRAQNPGLQIM